MQITVEPCMEPEFCEGELVCLKTDTSSVFLVACVAKGYENPQQGTFWAIHINGHRTSGGNYQKDLFQKFHGRIVIEA